MGAERSIKLALCFNWRREVEKEELLISNTIIGIIYLTCDKENVKYGTGKPGQSYC
jgi:hypothetical protein